MVLIVNDRDGKSCFTSQFRKKLAVTWLYVSWVGSAPLSYPTRSENQTDRIATCLPISYRVCIATAVHFPPILIFYF